MTFTWGVGAVIALIVFICALVFLLTGHIPLFIGLLIMGLALARIL